MAFIVLIRRDVSDDEWVVDDSVPFGEAEAEYMGVRLGHTGIGMGLGGGPRYRIRVSAESVGWALAVNLAESYTPEGLAS